MATVDPKSKVHHEPGSPIWWVGYLCLWTSVLVLLAWDTRSKLLEYDLKSMISYLYDAIPKPSMQATSIYILYLFYLAIMGAILPGFKQQGAVLQDGSSLTYKCNGLLLHLTTSLGFLWLATNTYIDPLYIADHYGELFASVSLFSLCLSLYLAIVGRWKQKRNWFTQRPFLIDFIAGAELNPHLLGLDIKFFAYRPAMTGWQLVNLSFLVKQYYYYDGAISARMAMYQILTALYILDYFYQERKMVFTWDIIAEHFGLMLVWGDLAFITFGFSVQNFFLWKNFEPFSRDAMIFNAVVALVGYTLFRGANSQKHHFKTNPNDRIWGKPPRLIGNKLLVSGFWGWARKINYCGDLIIALSFSLSCGSSSAWAYFYFLYLLLLLVHREMRDDEKCSEKYQALWQEYCREVPYRIVPLIY
mmetsp:Transcript_16283/g.28494  ORF Transcript_16283/g.28494 Transcript_16283/m.28494 type:complete len:417 (+) Transcript_16283:75-1325(+)